MEGYVWKRGHAMPVMNKRYCILEGTMLSYYHSSHEITNTPKGIYEILSISDWKTNVKKKYPFGFEIETLGKKSVQVSVETKEECDAWKLAIQKALNIPMEIIRSENEKDQKEAILDLQKEEMLKVKASQLISAAQMEGDDMMHANEKVKSDLIEWEEAKKEREHAEAVMVEMEESVRKGKELVNECKAKLHDLSVEMEMECLDGSDGTASVDRIKEATRLEKSRMKASILALENHTKEYENLQKTFEKLKLVEEVKRGIHAESVARLASVCVDAERLQQDAVLVVQEAQEAQDLRLQHATFRKNAASSVDALACGYLLYKTRLASSMNRRYFVLYGRTLVAFSDKNHFIETPSEPSLVVHVVEFETWNGKTGMKKLPHAFGINTLEGKVLHCSAPLTADVDVWRTAIQKGASMPPMSPTAAKKARAKKNYFFEATDDESSLVENSTVSSDTPVHILAEGYLVKQGHFVSSMKKQYCVLSGNLFSIYHTHADFATMVKPLGVVTVRGVTEWDGKNTIKHFKDAFQIMTEQHGHMWCSATSALDKKRWMGGVTSAVAKCSVALMHDSTLSPSPALSQTAFRTMVEEYFTTYLPEKLAEVDTLLEMYMHREMVFLQHLDEMHGTSLSSRSDLLEMLESYHDELTSSVGPPAMEGWLNHYVHLRHSKRIYGVLRGHILMLFASPMDTDVQERVEIAEVEEWNGELATITKSSPHIENGFMLLTSSGENYACSCTLSEEKNEWIVALHRHLGFARAHAPTHSSTSASSLVQSTLEEEDTVRSWIRSFYLVNNPSKLDEVDSLLSYFEGKEDEMILELDRTYGTSSFDTDEVSTMLQQLAATRAAKVPDLEDAVITEIEGFLKKKQGNVLGADIMVRVYVIVRQNTLSMFPSYEAAQNPASIPTFLETISNVADWESSSNAPCAFRLELSVGTPFFAEAESCSEKERWMNQIRPFTAEVSSSLRDESKGSLDFKAILTMYFAANNPQKAFEIPTLMANYVGREEELLLRLDSIYHTQLAQAQDVQLCLTTLRASTPIDPKEDSDISPHRLVQLEGYLLKRGHLIPAMLQRYCVLRQNVLTVFESHQDAGKGPTLAHDVLQLESVCSWDGKLSGKMNSFGFEFDTSEGHTYYCSASNQEERIHWIHAITQGIEWYRLEMESTTLTTSMETFRQLLVDYFTTTKPSVLEDLDPLLVLYRGMEMQLLLDLDTIFASDVQRDSKFLTVLSSLPVDAMTTLSCGYLLRKSSLGMGKQYAVLNDCILSFFKDLSSAKDVAKIEDTFKLLNVSEDIGTHHKQQEHAFHVGALVNHHAHDKHTVLYLAAENQHEAAEWMYSIKRALDRQNGVLLLRNEDIMENTSENVLPEGYLTCRNGSLPTMSEYYMVFNRDKLSLYKTTQEAHSSTTSPYLSVQVLAVKEWTPESLLHHDCQHPFQVSTTTVPLQLNASTEAEARRWCTLLQAGIDTQRAEKLLQDQENDMVRKPSSSFTGKGILTIQGTWSHKEVYAVLQQDTMLVYSSESEEGGTPVKTWSVQNVIERKNLPELAFEVHTVEGERIVCSVSSQALRLQWLTALQGAIKLKRGKQLLADESVQLLTKYAINSSVNKIHKERSVHLPGSSMEGTLCWKSSSFTSMHESYFALNGLVLQRFHSKSAAISGSKVLEIKNIASIRHWTGKEMLRHYRFGFTITFQENGVEWSLDAQGEEDKQLWMGAIREALDIEAADALLDGSLQNLSISTAVQTIPGTVSHADYMYVKQGLLSKLVERYVVIRDAWLYVYRSKAVAVDDPETGALIKCEPTGLSDWHGEDILKPIPFGFHIETLQAGTLECCVPTDASKQMWQDLLRQSMERLNASELVQRDTTLSLLSGARIEGYLRKKGDHFKALKTRYCALIGTQLLFYGSQAGALRNDLPTGVFEIVSVDDWIIKADLFDALEVQVRQHGFVVRTSTDRVLCLCAGTAAEKKLWMKSIQDCQEEADTAAIIIQKSITQNDEKQAVLLKARQKYASVKTENNRESSALKQFTQDDGWDDSDENDENPEISPMKRKNSQKTTSASLKKNTKNSAKKKTMEVRSPKVRLSFWSSFCVCFNRPAGHLALVEPLLTEDQKEYYQCDFYDSGASDAEF